MATSTRAISKTVLDRETDARFWAQTGYRVGQKLDPRNPADRAMAKVWLDIFAKVRREDAAGALVLTYNHPDVERHLDDAALAGHAAGAHLDAAVSEPDPDIAQQHVDAAAQAAARASSSAQDAAARQPPTVSPIVAEAAAQESATAAGLPAPPPVLANLPPDHPAHADAAHPALHPAEAAEAAAPPIAAPPASPLPPLGPLAAPPSPPATPPPPIASPSPLPRQHVPRQHVPGQHYAHAQAITSPSVAVRVHENAGIRAAAGGPPHESVLHPKTIGQIREVAARLAGDSQAQVVGVNYSADDQWSVPVFPSRSAAEIWYGHLTDTPDAFRYLAYFDKADPGTWPAPIGEVFGSGRALGATAIPLPLERLSPAHEVSIQTKANTSYGPIAAVGAVAVAGLLAIFAGGRRRSGLATRSYP